MPSPRDAAAYILVGGRSSRMGSDKALMCYQGIPLATHIAAQLAPVVDEVCLVGDPFKYGQLGWRVIADEKPGSGPVAAMVTALHDTRSTWNFVVACDVPGVYPDLFQRMLTLIQSLGVQCVIPLTSDGREQVLCAVYKSNALAGLAAAQKAGVNRLRTAVRTLDAHFWRLEETGWSINLNTPQDWTQFSRGEA